MDSAGTGRLSEEPRFRRQHSSELIDGRNQQSSYQQSRQNSTHKIINDYQVQGPQFSSLKFKRDIDKVSAKLVEDEINRSPPQYELLNKIAKNKKTIKIGSQAFEDPIENEVDDDEIFDDNTLQKYNHQNMSNNNNNNNMNNSNHNNSQLHQTFNFQNQAKYASIKQIQDQMSEQRLDFEEINHDEHDDDEVNQSFDLTDQHHNQRISRNQSASTKNKTSGQQQSYSQSQLQQQQNICQNDDFERTSIVQGILSLGVGSNNHKKRGSAIFINQQPISMQNSYMDQRKHSIFSAYQSNQNIDLRFNDSLSPSKLQINDLLSKGLTSEPGTPSQVKRRHNNENCNLQPGAQMQLLNLKQVSAYMTGDLTQVDKSMGDMSMKQQGFQGVWKKSAFTILTLTKKFINNIKELSMAYKFSQMKKHYFELIDDKANDFNFFHVNEKFQNDKPNYLQKIMYSWKGVFNKSLYINKIKLGQNNKIKILLSRLFNLNLGVLLPDDFIKIIWDSFILFLLLINLLYIPMKISFSEVAGFNEYLLVFFDDLPSWAFICDVILNFNTAYYSKGVIKTERYQIFKHYIKGSFCWDFIVVIPFFFSSILKVKFLNIILLLRTSKILKIVTNIEELLNLQQFQTCVLNLIKLCISIIYIAHICGCFFYYMHVLQIESDSTTITWIVKFGLQNSGWFSLYISSVYWAVITMITLGYGDLYPVTTLEKIYVIIVTLISCGVFAYAVNAIGYIIQDMTKKSTEFKAKMSSLLNHMKKREISNMTQMRVKKYFQYLHDEQHDDNEDGQKLLIQCNSSLKNEVLTEMYSKVLQSRKEFRLNFSKEFLMKIALKMKEKRLGPEEIIFKENEFCRKVYFVMRGNVALQRTRQTSNSADKEKQKEINMKILKKGDLFGLESFLTGSETNVCARTQNVVSLIYLRDEDFLSVIQDFQNDKERYCMIKDKLNLQKACRGSGICCSLCDSFSHQFLNCPYMSYQPNHRKVILRYLKDQAQDRIDYERQVHKTSATLSETLRLQEDAIRFLFDNNPYETVNELLEYIQTLDDEGALQINTPDIITKYLKDPQEFDDIDDLPEDEEIDQYIRASNNEGQSNNNLLNRDNQEDSVRIRRATVGSIVSRQDQQQQYSTYQMEQSYIPTQQFSNSYIRYGSLKMNRNNDGQLEVPRRNEERKSSFRKQTQFSTHDEVILIQNKDDKTPSRRIKHQNSCETSSMKQLYSENIINTPQLTHNVPSTPQLERNREKNSKYYNRSTKSLKEDDESQDNRHYINYNPGGGNSQVSIYQLDNMRTMSVKSGKSNKLIESKRDIEINNGTHYLPHYSSQVQQIKDFMTLPTFDRAQEWVVYYPHNNLNRVLESYQKLVNKRLLEKRKRKRKNHRTHSQKLKQMQQLFSHIQARNQQKNHSKAFSRNQKSKQSFISHKESSLNPIPRNPSQMLNASPRNDGREPSRSMISATDLQSEMPLQLQQQN